MWWKIVIIKSYHFSGYLQCQDPTDWVYLCKCPFDLWVQIKRWKYNLGPFQSWNIVSFDLLCFSNFVYYITQFENGEYNPVFNLTGSSPGCLVFEKLARRAFPLVILFAIWKIGQHWAFSSLITVYLMAKGWQRRAIELLINSLVQFLNLDNGEHFHHWVQFISWAGVGHEKLFNPWIQPSSLPPNLENGEHFQYWVQCVSWLKNLPRRAIQCLK